MTIDGDKSPERTPLNFSLFDEQNQESSETKEKKVSKRNFRLFQDDSRLNEGSCIKRQKVGFRRRVVAKARFPKIYPHIKDLEIVGKVVAINGVEYPIKEIAQGNFHKVYEFLEDVPVAVDDGGSVILKCFNQQKDPKSLISVKNEDIAAYEQLLNDGVPQPKVYIRPDQFVDTDDTNYGDFWIVEKMDGPAPIGEQYVLNFVKEWVTKSVIENREIIPDFYPRNLMVKNEQCFIVDPSPVMDKDEWLENIYGTVIAWSNGSEEIYEFLTSDFPQSIKSVFNEMLIEQKKKFSGQFPLTDQSKA